MHFSQRIDTAEIDAYFNTDGSGGGGGGSDGSGGDGATTSNDDDEDDDDDDTTATVPLPPTPEEIDEYSIEHALSDLNVWYDDKYRYDPLRDKEPGEY